MSEKEKEYTVWSDYEQVKAEIMYQHSLLIDSFNNYRMLAAMKRPERLREPYYTAGKALRKLNHYCILSGAWDKEDKEVKDARNIIDKWMSQDVLSSANLNKMDKIESQLEEWFGKTDFYDIRIMKNNPGNSILHDKSY